MTEAGQVTAGVSSPASWPSSPRPRTLPRPASPRVMTHGARRTSASVVPRRPCTMTPTMTLTPGNASSTRCTPSASDEGSASTCWSKARAGRHLAHSVGIRGRRRATPRDEAAS